MSTQPVRRVPASRLALEFPQSLAVFDSYEEAQKAVDYLSDNEFPVQNGLIVGAEKDEVVPQADIQKLVARLSLQKGITVESRTIKGPNHFFHDSLDKLAVDVDKYVAKSLLNPPGRATSNKEP